MFKKLFVVAASSMMAASAFAVNVSDVAKSIDLNDGSTVYIFANGKMGMENKFGRAVSMEPGHVMETRDGKKIAMFGSEISRTEEWLQRGPLRGSPGR